MRKDSAGVRKLSQRLRSKPTMICSCSLDCIISCNGSTPMTSRRYKKNLSLHHQTTYILPLISTTCMQIDKAIVTRNSKESVEHFLSHSKLAFDIGKNEIWKLRNYNSIFYQFNTENLCKLSVGSQLQTLQAFSRANPSHLWKVESETKRGHVCGWLKVNKFVQSIQFDQLIDQLINRYPTHMINWFYFFFFFFSLSSSSYTTTTSTTLQGMTWLVLRRLVVPACWSRTTRTNTWCLSLSTTWTACWTSYLCSPPAPTSNVQTTNKDNFEHTHTPPQSFLKCS